MRWFYLLLIPLIFISCASSENRIEQACPSEKNIIRLKEFVSLSKKQGGDFWAGWNNYEQGILFVESKYEFLFGHNKVPSGFKKGCYIEGIGRLWFRDQFFDKRMEASFPVFSQYPSIVIGSVENTSSKSSTEWLSIMIHERFHQIQYSQLDYYDRVKEITPQGAEGGSWMLNYKFPYSNKKVGFFFREMGRLLLDSIDKKNKSQFYKYQAVKKSMLKHLSKDDYNYMNFQMWQEGISRYIELQSLSVLARQSFSSEFLALNDYERPIDIYERKLALNRKRLKEKSLSELKRGAFYVLGLFEGIALDIFKPSWKKSYLSASLTL